VIHFDFQRADKSVFNSPDLVVRIGEQYYKWSAACPIIMSTILYGRTLPSDLVEVIRGSFQEPKNSLDDKMILHHDVASSPGSSAQKKHSSSWWPFSSKKEEEEQKRESSADQDRSISAPEVSSVQEIPTTLVEEKETTPRTTTRYSMGTQTTFLEDKVLSLETDENEAETLLTNLKGKEKFRKTLRLSNEAIVSELK
jgi:phosphatidate phosphatase LPIN